jgi:hypothetical protein
MMIRESAAGCLAPGKAVFKKKAALLWKAAFKFSSLPAYLLASQSFTISGAITDSTKVYAPDLGDFTILMALVIRLDEDWRVATVFFAMFSYLISLCTVMRFRIGLYFLISILSGEFFLFFVVM